MRLAGFWSGVAASVVSGIALYFVFSFYEGEPHVTWFAIGRFELPPKEFKDGDFSYVRPQSLEVFVISNSGFQPARNIRVEYSGFLTEMIVTSALGQKSTTLGADAKFIELEAIAPRSQALVAVFSEPYGNLKVIFDGGEARQNHDDYLVATDGNRWIRVPDVITIIFWLFFLAPVSYVIVALTFGVQGGDGRKDNPAENNDEKNV